MEKLPAVRQPSAVRGAARCVLHTPQARREVPGHLEALEVAQHFGRDGVKPPILPNCLCPSSVARPGAAGSGYGVRAGREPRYCGKPRRLQPSRLRATRRRRGRDPLRAARGLPPRRGGRRGGAVRVGQRVPSPGRAPSPRPPPSGSRAAPLRPWRRTVSASRRRPERGGGRSLTAAGDFTEGGGCRCGLCRGAGRAGRSAGIRAWGERNRVATRALKSTNKERVALWLREAWLRPCASRHGGAAGVLTALMRR